MKTPSLFARLLIVACCGLSCLHGMYLEVETEQVPIKRIITNLTAKVESAPENADLCHQLARAHSLAFSRKLIGDEGVAAKKEDKDHPWFGYEPNYVPFAETQKTDDPKRLEEARKHLDSAIKFYQIAHKLKPDDLTILLGLSWCLDQAGEKAAALAGYRRVLEKTWITEKERDGTFGPILHVETSGYILPLLDAAKDAVEIQRIKERNETLLALPRAITPLIVPLTAGVDRLESLLDPQARVKFDLDGSGRKLEWSWITADAGWLVYDPQMKGRITSAIQMFGSRTFLLFHNDGYQALSLLDDDHDGEIRGAELDGLALWRDGNGNGVSEEGEVKPLSFHGIRELSTHSQPHISGIPWSQRGVTFTDGSTRPTYDVIVTSH